MEGVPRRMYGTFATTRMTWTWGDKQAKDYLLEIKNCLENLIVNPELGKPRNDICEGLRSIGVSRHVVFYRIGKTDIEIVRVLHGRMDVVNQFGHK